MTADCPPALLLLIGSTGTIGEGQGWNGKGQNWGIFPPADPSAGRGCAVPELLGAGRVGTINKSERGRSSALLVCDPTVPGLLFLIIARGLFGQGGQAD